ncbi:MAG: FHA domain-containing protein, partial [Nodosilinea sp.]
MIANQEKSTIDAIATILDRSFANKGLDVESATIASSIHVLIVKNAKTQKVHFLPKSRYTIGRNKDNDIQISSKGISRYHATLYRCKDAFWIVDGSENGIPSTNGLLINQKICKSSKINSGDIVSFCSDVYAVFFEINPGDKKSCSPQNSDFLELSSTFKAAKNCSESDGVASFLNIIPDLIIKFDSNGVIEGIKESKDPVFSAYGKHLISTSIFACFSSCVSKRISLVMGAVKMTGNSQAFDCEIIGGGAKKPCEIEVFIEGDGMFFAVLKNI